MADTLTVGCTVAGIDVNYGDFVKGGYILHAESRNSAQITWRKQSVENIWVEGTYDVQAVRGNVTESLVVWVVGADQNDFQQKKAQLVDAMASPAFSIVWTLDGMTETWDCTFSDYTVETQVEYQYARSGILRFTITRRPRVTITYVDGSTYTG